MPNKGEKPSKHVKTEHDKIVKMQYRGVSKRKLQEMGYHTPVIHEDEYEWEPYEIPSLFDDPEELAAEGF